MYAKEISDFLLSKSMAQSKLFYAVLHTVTTINLY